MIRVRLLGRYGPYFPGADPVLDDMLAKRLIDSGVAKAFEEQADEPVAEKTPAPVAESVETVADEPAVEEKPVEVTPNDVPDKHDGEDEPAAGEPAGGKGSSPNLRKRFGRGGKSGS